MTNHTNVECQSLIFRKGGRLAQIVTDGTHTAVFQENGRRLFPTLGRAIATLEVAGYEISMDDWVNFS